MTEGTRRSCLVCGAGYDTLDCVCGSPSRLTARGDVDRGSHRDGASLTYLYRSTDSEAAE